MSPERVEARRVRVLAVRALFDAGLTYAAIGAQLGLTAPAVSAIAYKNHFPKRWPCRVPAPCRKPPPVPEAAGELGVPSVVPHGRAANFVLRRAA